VTRHVLQCFAKVRGDTTVAICEDKVCRFVAEVILRATQKVCGQSADLFEY
jgi:hypothetical protein